MNIQELIKSNLLVWEEAKGLPIPEEVKPLITETNWSEFIWNSSGLPVPYAKYSVTSGKDLYIEELPSGEMAVQKQDFTGVVLFTGYIIDHKKVGEFNYFLTFKATFLKGELIEVVLYKLDKQEFAVYEKAIDKFNTEYKRKVKLVNSWWFKYLYKPYYHTVRFIFVCLIFPFELACSTLGWLFRLITPW